MFNIPMNTTQPMNLGNMPMNNKPTGTLAGLMGMLTGNVQGNTNNQYQQQPQNNYADPQQQTGYNQSQNGFGMNPQQDGFNQQHPQQDGFNQQPPQQGGFNQQHQPQGGFNTQPPQQGFQQPQPQGGFNPQPPQQGFQQPQPQGGFNPQPPQQGFQQPQPQGGFNPQPPQQGFQQPPQPRQRPAAGGVMLKKGQKTSLSSMNPGLDLIEVGLGWDLTANGMAYDLDVEAFMLGQNGKVLGDDWFVFYGQPDSPDNSISLLKSSTDGAGAGDDEIMQIKLSKVNQGISKILFIVTINEAKTYGYNFSNVANAYVRIVDRSTGTELMRFQLTDYYNTVSSMMIGEIYRHNNEWKFNPIGDGVADDLEGLCVRYGVNVG